ncbi:MAG: cation transporter [Mycoplasmataceae bacterium]|nr:cation transporter [Mycoplasmataceae bacterium]
MKKLRLKVNMDCASCAVNIDKTLKKMGCVSQSNPALKLTKVEYDESKTSPDEIIKKIKGIGYDAKQ